MERDDDCDPIRRIADCRCNSTDLGRGGTTAGEAPCHHGGTGRRKPAHTARPVCRLGRLYRLAYRRKGLLRALQADILEDRAGRRKREPAYIFVATRPAENVKNELSVIVGYPFKSTSDATAEIGTAKFAMYKSLPAPHARTLASRARGIVNASSGITSSGIEENVDFWIDEAKRSLVLADGTPLIVHRFDDRWISAARGDVSYELDRQGGNLTYASSPTNDGVTTIIIGAGTVRKDPLKRLSHKNA